MIDGENKTVSYLICGEYKLANTSWSKLHEKYHVSRDKVYTAVKGKKRPCGSQYEEKSKNKKQTKEMSNITKIKAEETKTAVPQEPNENSLKEVDIIKSFPCY